MPEIRGHGHGFRVVDVQSLRGGGAGACCMGTIGSCKDSGLGRGCRNRGYCGSLGGDEGLAADLEVGAKG